MVPVIVFKIKYSILRLNFRLTYSGPPRMARQTTTGYNQDWMTSSCTTYGLFPTDKFHPSTGTSVWRERFEFFLTIDNFVQFQIYRILSMLGV
jgi:hypothetical protein